MKQRAWLWYFVAGLVTVGGHFLVHGTAQARVYELLGLSSALALGTGLRLHRPPRPIGWVLVLCPRERRSAPEGLIDAAIVATGTGVVIWIFVVHRYEQADTHSMAALE